MNDNDTLKNYFDHNEVPFKVFAIRDDLGIVHTTTTDAIKSSFFEEDEVKQDIILMQIRYYLKKQNASIINFFEKTALNFLIKKVDLFDKKA